MTMLRERKIVVAEYAVRWPRRFVVLNAFACYGFATLIDETLGRAIELRPTSIAGRAISALAFGLLTRSLAVRGRVEPQARDPLLHER